MTCKALWLGTALWGWGVDKKEALALLDMFAAAGGRWIDTAVNYPISGRPADFGAACAIISEWITANPASGLRVMCKVGALDNTGGPLSNLGASAVSLSYEFARQKFGDALGGLGVHWDNRTLAASVAETIDVLRHLRGSGLTLCLSGIQSPRLYAELAPDLAEDWWIQVKDNAATCAAYDNYIKHLPKANFIAYGVNMGGVKFTHSRQPGSSLSLRGLEEPDVAARLLAAFAPAASGFPRDLNDLSLISVISDTRLRGCIAGPRNCRQLTATLDCWSWASSATMEERAPALAMIARATGMGHLAQ